jgi:hypothetical protein
VPPHRLTCLLQSRTDSQSCGCSELSKLQGILVQRNLRSMVSAEWGGGLAGDVLHRRRSMSCAQCSPWDLVHDLVVPVLPLLGLAHCRCARSKEYDGPYCLCCCVASVGTKSLAKPKERYNTIPPDFPISTHSSFPIRIPPRPHLASKPLFAASDSVSSLSAPHGREPVC